MTRAHATILLLALLPAAGCGSGIFAGIFAGSRDTSNPAPPVRPPQVVVEPSSVPYLPQSDLLVSVLIQNFALRGEAFFELRHAALAGPTPRQKAILPSVQGSVTSFFANLTPALAELRRALGVTIPDRNTVVSLRVIADGDFVGQPVQLILNRTPIVAELRSKENNNALEVTVGGTSQFRFDVRHMTALDNESDLVGLDVLQRNYLVPRLIGNAPNPEATRRVRVANKGYARQPNGLSRVSGTAPPTRFPGIGRIALTDPRAGLTLGGEPQTQPDLPLLLYVPELSGVIPSTRSILGGSLSSLQGRGLLPAEHESDAAPFRFLFGDIKITLEKGGSTYEVDASAIIEDESNELQVRFRTPPSPDGLPGRTTIELEQQLGDFVPRSHVARVRLARDEPNTIRYRVDQPVLGPFVSLIAEDGRFSLRTGRFRPGTAVGSDVALLSESAGIGQVELMRAHGVGLYRRAGNAISSVHARSPHGFLGGGFASPNATDLFVIGGSWLGRHPTGEHALLKTSALPNSIDTPFVRKDVRYMTGGRVIDFAAGDFDEDGTLDVVLLPEPTSPLKAPQIWLAIDRNPTAKLIDAQEVRGTRLHVADLDGDGHQDIVVAAPAKPWNVFVYYGDGAGGFPSSRRQLVTYDPGSSWTLLDNELVGIVSYASASPGKHRHLCVVAAVDVVGTRPALLPLLFDPRQGEFSPPREGHVAVDLSLNRFSIVQTMDIVGDATEELLCATLESTLLPVRGFVLGESQPSLLPTGVGSDLGMVQIAAMQPAVLWHGRGSRPDVEGLLVLHDEIIDGRETPVLSALPKSSKGLVSRVQTLVQRNEPRRTAVGDFDADGVGGDCAADNDDMIVVHAQAAPGIYDIDDPEVIDPGPFLATSMTSLGWQGEGDLLCWLTETGRLSVLFPGAAMPLVVPDDLRRYLPARVRGRLLGSGSALIPCEGSLVVWLQPSSPAPSDEGALVFLRSAAAQMRGRNPFVLPQGALLAPATAQHPACGDFLSHDSKRPGLEVVLVAGDRIQVATLDLAEPGMDVFRPWSLGDLSVGPSAAWPVVEDLDGDGRDDLAFLLTGERRLEILINRIRIVDGQAIGRLISFSGPTLTYLGDAFGLAAADMDGDGLRDLFVAATIQRINRPREPSPCLFRNEGRATFSPCYTYPVFFLGPVVPKTFAVFDMDENGLSDLVLGRRVLLSR